MSILKAKIPVETHNSLWTLTSVKMLFQFENHHIVNDRIDSEVSSVTAPEVAVI